MEQTRSDQLKDFLVIKNLIDENMINKLLAYLKSDSVRVLENSSSHSIMERNLYVDRIMLPLCPDMLRVEIMFMTFYILCEVVSKNYNITFESCDLPYFLRYPEGKPDPNKPTNNIHIDESFEMIDGKRVKTIRRDYSFMLYLNNDFEGGELFFPKQNVMFKPEPGMLVAFPGDSRYPHGVNEITKGTRYAFSVSAQKTTGEFRSVETTIPLEQTVVGKIPQRVEKYLEDYANMCQNVTKNSDYYEDF